MTTATQTQIRRDTATNLTAATPAAGELGYDTTNKRIVAGDGTTAGGIKIPSFKDVQNQVFTAADAGGSADAYTLTLAPVPAAYAAYQNFKFKAGFTNTTTTPTLNVNSLGAKTIKKKTNSGIAALAAGDIQSGCIYAGTYDGTYVQVDVAAAASATQKLRIRQLTQGTTYTVPSDAASFYVFVNGGTGSIHNVGSGGSGGAGGAGYAEKYYSAPAGPYTYSIGPAPAGTSAAAGGTVAFDTTGANVQVTGSGGVASTTVGSAGGVGSNGDFNATGGAGGAGRATASVAPGGGGGAASRAGNGGSGGAAASGVAGAGGGTGANNATGATAGIAGTLSGSALILPFNQMYESFQAGITPLGTSAGPGAGGASSFDILNLASIIGGAAGQAGLITASQAGSQGSITIIEILK